METEKKPGFWAIVELYGHNKIAGLLTEETIAGQAFVRVDVPELPAIKPEPLGESFDGYSREKPAIAKHTKFFGAGAIYAINPVDEVLATAAAREIRHIPVSSYSVENAIESMTSSSKQRLLGSSP